MAAGRLRPVPGAGREISEDDAQRPRPLHRAVVSRGGDLLKGIESKRNEARIADYSLPS